MNDRIRKADEFAHQQHANREAQRAATLASNPLQMPDSPRNDPLFVSDLFVGHVAGATAEDAAGWKSEKEMHANFGQPRRTDTYDTQEGDQDRMFLSGLFNRDRTRDV